jgi:hypothetical protein
LFWPAFVFAAESEQNARDPILLHISAGQLFLVEMEIERAWMNEGVPSDSRKTKGGCEEFAMANLAVLTSSRRIMFSSAGINMG